MNQYLLKRIHAKDTTPIPLSRTHKIISSSIILYTPQLKHHNSTHGFTKAKSQSWPL